MADAGANRWQHATPIRSWTNAGSITHLLHRRSRNLTRSFLQAAMRCHRGLGGGLAAEPATVAMAVDVRSNPWSKQYVVKVTNALIIGWSH